MPRGVIWKQALLMHPPQHLLLTRVSLWHPRLQVFYRALYKSPRNWPLASRPHAGCSESLDPWSSPFRGPGVVPVGLSIPMSLSPRGQRRRGAAGAQPEEPLPCGRPRAREAAPGAGAPPRGRSLSAQRKVQLSPPPFPDPPSSLPRFFKKFFPPSCPPLAAAASGSRPRCRRRPPSPARLKGDGSCLCSIQRVRRMERGQQRRGPVGKRSCPGGRTPA